MRQGIKNLHEYARYFWSMRHRDGYEVRRLSNAVYAWLSASGDIRAAEIADEVRLIAWRVRDRIGAM